MLINTTTVLIDEIEKLAAATGPNVTTKLAFDKDSRDLVIIQLPGYVINVVIEDITCVSVFLLNDPGVLLAQAGLSGSPSIAATMTLNAITSFLDFIED